MAEDDFDRSSVPPDDAVLRRSPLALWRRLLGGVLLLAPDMNEPMRLSQPADVLWEVLAEPVRLDALITLLAELHDVEASVVRADVLPLIVRLLDCGAVTSEAG